jgi:DNA polymerase-3 subunit delta
LAVSGKTQGKRFTAKGYGGAVLEKMRARMGDGWPAGLTVLAGKDIYHMDQAQEELLADLVPPGSTDFSLTVFGEDMVDVSTVISAARSIGMFSPKRVILVQEVSALDGEAEAITAYAKQAPEGSYLIVRATDLDKRRKLHKALVAAGHVLEFSGVTRGDEARFKDDVKKQAASRNLTLTKDVGVFLMATSMGNLYQVIRELDKIRDWFGGSEEQTVRLEDARQVLSGTELLEGWEVADAILDRNEAAAILAVRKLLQFGGNAIQLLGGVAHRARTMLQARAMLETGRSRRDIVSATHSYYIQDRLFTGIGRYSFHDLQKFPGRLMKADRALKSSSVDPCLILESLLQEMIAGQAQDRVQ